MWSNYLGQLDPYEMVKQFAAKGWDALEMSNEHAHELLAERGDPFETGRAFREYAADHGVSFPQGHFYLSKSIRITGSGSRVGEGKADIAAPEPADVEAALEQMERWVALFAGLGVEAGVLHAGGYTLAELGWTEERMLEHRAESLRRVSEMAQGTGVTICVENLFRDRCGSQTASEIRKLIETAGGDTFGICLDTGHANIVGLDLADFVDQAGEHLRALHVTDNLGKKDDHILPYSHGTVNWGRLMDALRRVGYDRLFNFEIPGETKAYPGSGSDRQPLPVLLMKLDYARALGEWMIG
jgi:sugar phosphate isomerase/epimerase